MSLEAKQSFIQVFCQITVTEKKMSGTYSGAYNKRITPDDGFDGRIASQKPRLEEAASKASGGDWRNMGHGSDYGTNAWARGLADRLSTNGLRNSIGSTRFTNEGTFIRVLSLNGTEESDADLEFQPVWAQQLDRSFHVSNPFVRNPNAVSEPQTAIFDDRECPVMRVMTNAEVNLLLSHETGSNNMGARGRRRTPAETLEHLGISFLGFVQNSTRYGRYRLMAIFKTGYALCGLPSKIIPSPIGCKIWLESSYTTQEDARKKGVGAGILAGSSGLQVPAPNMASGSAMVADPVQVRILVGPERPYLPAGKGTVEYLGRIEKINVAGTENAPSHARVGMPKADNGRYQIVLYPDSQRRWC